MTSTPTPVVPDALGALTRDELAVLLREWLLHGHLQDRVGIPLLYEQGLGREEAEEALNEMFAEVRGELLSEVHRRTIPPRRAA